MGFKNPFIPTLGLPDHALPFESLQSAFGCLPAVLHSDMEVVDEDCRNTDAEAWRLQNAASEWSTQLSHSTLTVIVFMTSPPAFILHTKIVYCQYGLKTLSTVKWLTVSGSAVKKRMEAKRTGLGLAADGGGHPHVSWRLPQESLWSARIGEYRVQPQLRNTGKMPQVPTDQFQIVVDGRRCDLKICIRQRPSSILQLRRKEPVHLGHGCIIGQYGHCGQDPLPDVEQMALPARRTEGSSVQFTDHHGTCKLIFARDAPEPFDIGRSRSKAQQFRDGVRIEKISHPST
jgi:hypothetical protein